MQLLSNLIPREGTKTKKTVQKEITERTLSNLIPREGTKTDNYGHDAGDKLIVK